jgi:hypothetical protein
MTSFSVTLFFTAPNPAAYMLLPLAPQGISSLEGVTHTSFQERNENLVYVQEGGCLM